MNFKNNVLLEKKQLFALCITIMIFNLSYSVLVPIMPMFFNSLGVSTSMIGYTMSLYAVSKTVFQIPSGLLSDFIGDKYVLTICLSLLCILLFSYTIFNGGILISFIYILEGAVAGMATPAIYSILSRSVDEDRRGESLGMFTALSSLGIAIGPLLSGVIISKFERYNLAFYIAAIGTLITIVLVSINIKKISNGIKKEEKSEKKDKIWFKRIVEEVKNYKLGLKILMFGVIALLGDFIYGSMATVFPLYSKNVLNLPIVYTSFIISLNFFIFSFSAPLAGRLSDLIGNTKLIFWSLITMIIVFIALFFIKSPVLFTIIIIGEFFGGACLYSSLQSSLSKIGNDSDIKGLVYGFTGTFQAIGLAIGPIYSVYTYEFNNKFLFPGLSFISLIVLLIYVIIKKNMKEWS